MMMRRQQLTSTVAQSYRRQLHRTGPLALALVICLLASSVIQIGADQQQDLLVEGSDQQQRSIPLARQLLGARFRRQAGGQARNSGAANSNKQLLAVSQLASQLNQQAEQQQMQDPAPLENDEQTLRRQLPDLIAQAHTDKTVERALLRLLINASLRSGLSNIAAMQQRQSQQQQQPSGGWQLDSIDNSNNNLAQYNQANSGSMGEFVPIRLARLEQSDYANLDPQLAVGLGGLGSASGGLAGQELLQSIEQQQQHANQHHHQFQSTSMDKREYIKPCSFNAISCVRTPFRRLIEPNRAT